MTSFRAREALLPLFVAPMGRSYSSSWGAPTAPHGALIQLLMGRFYS
jgi:hypothetical protein